MMLSVENFIVLILIASILGENCDNLGTLLYEDLGCTPHQAEGAGCPNKYSCGSLEAITTNCTFRGKAYERGQSVERNKTISSCSLNCICSPVKESPEFACFIRDCPEWFGEPLEPECYRAYDLNQCCSVGQLCPSKDTIATCKVGKRIFREGERFDPENTCLNCVCQKGFQGKLEEPFCRRYDCGIELSDDGHQAQKACAPFYGAKINDVLCCPDTWICPDGSEEIVGDIDSEEICRFGNTTLKIGQSLEKLNVTDHYGRTFEKVNCDCVLPPLLRCLQP